MRALLLDAMGTLLRLPEPSAALVRELRERHGAMISADVARRALGDEVSYYRAHHDEGSDPAALADLRLRCATVLRASLGPAAEALAPAQLLPTLMAALRFEAFPDALRVLPRLRARGVRLVVASNWDISLPEVLAATGLSGALDAVLTSAEVGASKPAPPLFAAALGRAGVSAGQAMFVGDSVEHDVRGARAAGIRSVLIKRDGGRSAPDGVPVIATLDELLVLAA